jgi:hypothetical protein
MVIRHVIHIIYLLFISIINHLILDQREYDAWQQSQMCLNIYGDLLR